MFGILCIVSLQGWQLPVPPERFYHIPSQLRDSVLHKHLQSIYFNFKFSAHDLAYVRCAYRIVFIYRRRDRVSVCLVLIGIGREYNFFKLLPQRFFIFQVSNS